MTLGMIPRISFLALLQAQHFLFLVPNSPQYVSIYLLQYYAFLSFLPNAMQNAVHSTWPPLPRMITHRKIWCINVHIYK